MAKLISKTYGDALVELAVEENEVDRFSQEISQLLVVLKENPELIALLNHPRISVDEKTEVVKNVFSGRISEEMMGFLLLVVTKGRSTDLNDILIYFLDRIKELKGIGVAYVTTPIELSDSRKKEIENKLLDTTEFKEMEMNYRLNPDLIGGMQIQIGDRVVDSSIATMIQKMQQSLLKIQL